MLGAINRLENNSRDWSQANETTTSNTHNTAPTAAIGSPGLPQAGKPDLEVKEKITKELGKLNDQMVMQNRAFRFKYNDDAELFYVQVIDARTQEVIESLPPDYLLDLSAKLKEITGLFVDKRM